MLPSLVQSVHIIRKRPTTYVYLDFRSEKFFKYVNLTAEHFRTPLILYAVWFAQ